MIKPTCIERATVALIAFCVLILIAGVFSLPFVPTEISRIATDVAIIGLPAIAVCYVAYEILLDYVVKDK